MPAFIGPAIGAGGSIIGGAMGKGAASKAADAQVKAAQIAQETQLQMYLQNREDLRPWREAGQIGLNTLMNRELGVGGDGSSQDPWLSGEIQKYRDRADPYFGAASDINQNIWGNISPYLERAESVNPRILGLADRVRDEGRPGETGLPVWFENAAKNFRGSPDYTFARDESLRAMAGKLAAAGQFGSGGQIRAMGQQASGLASQNYENYKKTALDQWRQNIGAEAGLANEYRANELEGGKLTGTALGDIYTRYMQLGKNQLDLGSYANEQYQNMFKRLADITGYGVGATKSSVEAGTHYADAASNLQAASGNALANAALRQGTAGQNMVGGVTGNLQNYFNNQYAQQSSPYNNSSSNLPSYTPYSGYGTGYSTQSYTGYDPLYITDAGGGGGGYDYGYGNYS